MRHTLSDHSALTNSRPPGWQRSQATQDESHAWLGNMKRGSRAARIMIRMLYHETSPEAVPSARRGPATGASDSRPPGSYQSSLLSKLSRLLGERESHMSTLYSELSRNTGICAIGKPCQIDIRTPSHGPQKHLVTAGMWTNDSRAAADRKSTIGHPGQNRPADGLSHQPAIPGRLSQVRSISLYPFSTRAGDLRGCDRGFSTFALSVAASRLGHAHSLAPRAPVRSFVSAWRTSPNG